MPAVVLSLGKFDKKQIRMFYENVSWDGIINQKNYDDIQIINIVLQFI
jgi:hypothetical protein